MFDLIEKAGTCLLRRSLLLEAFRNFETGHSQHHMQ
jgi:hypothetical protein